MKIKKPKFKLSELYNNYPKCLNWIISMLKYANHTASNNCTAFHLSKFIYEINNSIAINLIINEHHLNDFIIELAYTLIDVLLNLFNVLHY